MAPFIAGPDTLTFPDETAVVEITTPPCAAFTTMLRLWLTEAGGNSASVSCTVKVEVPATAGVPVITPALLKVSPGGTFPLASRHK
jgi:hypothetical protein